MNALDQSISNEDQYFNDPLLNSRMCFYVNLDLSIEVAPKYGNVCVRARNKAYLGTVFQGHLGAKVFLLESFFLVSL